MAPPQCSTNSGRPLKSLLRATALMRLTLRMAVPVPIQRSLRRRPRLAPLVAIDSEESAAAAGLRYVSETVPGIRRKGAGKGFVYVGVDGKTIRDQKILN